MTKKLGIKEAAKAMGVNPASARARFRKAGIKPKGTSYEWDSQKAMLADTSKTTGPAVKSSNGKKKVVAKSKKVAPKRRVKRAGGDAHTEA